MEQQTLGAELQTAFALRLAADQQVYAAITRLAEVIEQDVRPAPTLTHSGAPERFYSVKETCVLLGHISRTTLHRLCHRKRQPLKFVRIGNRPMFAASVLEAFMRGDASDG
jgi:hypothetical protein